MLHKLRTLFILAVGILALYFVFHGLEWEKLKEAFGHFQTIWLLPALVLYLIGYVIRGFRWVVLLSPVKKCRFNSLFPTLLIGFMLNNVLPLRLGEFIRAYLNGKKENISGSASLATIILERLFDGLTMVLILTFAIKFGRLPLDTATLDPGIQKAIRWAPVVFGAAFVGMFLLILFRRAAESSAKFVTALAPAKIRPVLERLSGTFLEGLKILKNPKETLTVLLTSVAAWTCEFTSYYWLARGFGLSPHPVTFFTAALLMAVVNLGILIPNAPGGFGLFEAIGKLLLLPLGVGAEMAVAYILVVHLVVWAPITLWGLYYFMKEGLSLRQIENEQQASRGKALFSNKK